MREPQITRIQTTVSPGRGTGQRKEKHEHKGNDVGDEKSAARKQDRIAGGMGCGPEGTA
jgi:hypothetical protein